MQVNYRYSEKDFVAVLLLHGYTYNKIEVAHNKKRNVESVFFYFEADDDILATLYKEYKDGNTIFSAVDILKMYKEVLYLSSIEIQKYKLKNKEASILSK